MDREWVVIEVSDGLILTLIAGLSVVFFPVPEPRRRKAITPDAPAPCSGERA